MPETIDVYTRNGVYLEIDTEAGIASEMSDYFSFMTPNYKFTPAYKSGRWDGRIRFFSYFTQTLYSGLYETLVKFANERDYVVNDKRQVPDPLFSSNEEFDALLQSYEPHSDGVPIEYHEHQVKAIKACMKNSNATILSPTSSGKSLIIYTLIRELQKTDIDKILIVVPTVQLVEQMRSDFEDYSTKNGWDAVANCHRIRAGKEKNSEKQIYISTWQSIHTQPKEYFAKFSSIMCDEVHGAEAKSLTGITEKCTNAWYRWGFTGTLKDTKANVLQIVGLFGSVHKIISTKELMDKGLISQLEIRPVVMKYPLQECKKLRALKEYQKEVDYIVTHKGRLQFVASLADSVSKNKGNTLVLFQFVPKHGIPLHQLIKKIVTDRPVFYIDGGVKAEERERIRGEMEKTTGAILVASYQTLSTGVNIKNLHNIIFASPTKSKIRVLQSIGRGLRKLEGKEICTLYDLVDDFSHKLRKHTWLNYVLKHFMSRYEIYKNEKFTIKIKEIRF